MITKRPLFYWVKTSNLKLQFLLLILIIITVGARVLPLEMQKKIVNLAIGTRRINLLFLYCGYYLVAVLVASSLKYVITLLQTYIGQRALARIRKELYQHILTLPMDFFRKASPGMVVSSLVTEVATTGDFVGQAISVPLTNLLTLIAFAAYMFYLNPLLAIVSILSYPLIAVIVPVLQSRSNQANKQRVDSTRELSSRIGEAIAGIHEIHGNGSYRIENRKFGKYVDDLMRFRVVWILYKQGIKALNNFFQNLGPFILFLIGGYLSINGRLDLGALVAFLSAHEKLFDPWKELMEFYQTHQDANVSYKRIMEYFDIEPPYSIEPSDRAPYELQGQVSTRDVSLVADGGIRILRQANLDLQPGEHLALVGFSGSGKTTLAQCIGQLQKYTTGSVRLDGNEVSLLTKRDIVQNIGIVAQSPYVFNGTIRENLLYSCEALLDGEGDENESQLPDLDEMIQVTQQVGIFVDVLRFGLNAILKPEKRKLADKVVRVRSHFHDQFGNELADHVEFFDEHRYLHYSSVATNLIFGNPNREEYTHENLPENRYFLDFLNESQLRNPLLDLGRELAKQSVDILGNLKADEIFFQQSPIRAEELQNYKDLVGRCEHAHLNEISQEDLHLLLKLGLRFTPSLHKMVTLQDMLQNLILEGRYLFMEKISKDYPDAVAFYRKADYIYTQSILDNILFGRPRSDHPRTQERINQSIIHCLVEEDLLERIVEIGMNFRVGTKGDRLSGGQRQKLAIARVLLKKPRIIIMDEATSALDNSSQKRIQNLLETTLKGKSTLISVVHRLDTIKGYDKVAVMKAGRIMEMGPYEELMARKGMLYELVHGPRTT